MNDATVLVTGDIVLDCNLYGGVRTLATSFSEPGTSYREQLGGAALTRDLLQAAADVDGLAWDALRRKWEAENKKRGKEGKAPLPRPDDLPEQRPAASYCVHLDLDTDGLEKSLPPHLRSYGVWTDRPDRKGGTKDRVWRATAPFGYGANEPTNQAGVFTRTRNRPAGDVVLNVIDDGGILFRHGASASVWPVRDNGRNTWFLLKFSWPLCRSDLWAALETVKDRLIVVVSAANVRREDVQVNPRLSWEQCVEDTIDALGRDPVAGELLRAAHVVVNYESEGALWFERNLRRWRLLFAPNMLESDHARQFDGSTYGFQTCLAASIAHQLMAAHNSQNDPQHLGPLVDPAVMRRAISRGISGGLITRRLLLELGHGLVGRQAPGIPVEDLGRTVAKATEKQGGFVTVDVPDAQRRAPACQWTILWQSEEGADRTPHLSSPLTGLAQLTALYGPSALSHVPALRMGKLLTVDRSEIESLRMLEELIANYERTPVQSKPLSIGVFGPPGAGKSFGVKALAKSVLGENSPFLEFNLSQFKSPDELNGAFHRVRDEVLRGMTPVAFWDEFDSQKYRWLQYLLAPMQDGAFQDGQITHPIGKCVFIFAGGTASTMEDFGVAQPIPPTETDDAMLRQSVRAGSDGGSGTQESELAALRSEQREERRRAHREQCERYREFVLLKGPDFVSRLHGFLNVLGPNPRTGTRCPDVTWPIRRAIILRGILRVRDGEILDVDRGLLNALLAVPGYAHGARSFEKIVTALDRGQQFGRLNRSALPPQPLLDRETDAAALRALLTAADAFKKIPDLEALAAAFHHKFLDAAERSRIDAEAAANPSKVWEINPAIRKSYDALDADSKAANRAAARRIPDHLQLIGYVLEPRRETDRDDWRHPLESSIEQHLDRLAQAEHLGWSAERRANGWTYAPVRNDTLKQHTLLVDWASLTETNRDKDRALMRAIPDLLDVARFKAVRVVAAP